MHLDDIATLRIVAACGSVSEAAVVLNMSQSAVSQRIRQLERQLGVKLFEREGRGIALTSEGEIVRRYAERIALTVRELKQELATAPGRQQVLTIGASPIISVTILPPLIRQFRRRMPDVMVKVLSTMGAKLRAQILAGEVDFGVFARHLLPPEIEARPLLTERYLLIAPGDHPLASLRRPITAEEAASYPIIDVRVPPEGRSVLTTWADMQRVTPRLAMEVDSSGASVMSVRAGIGLGFAIEPALAVAGGSGEIVALDMDTGLSVEICLGFARTPVRSEAAEVLLETLESGEWRDEIPRVAPLSQLEPASPAREFAFAAW